MRLADLLVGYEWKTMSGSDFLDADIQGITADSRQVKPGYLFAALPGLTSDGADFIPDAIDAGAVAVLTSLGTTQDFVGEQTVSFVPDSNPRRRYAKMVGRFYQPQPTHIAAITGTNGKSSVADFTRQLWQACDLPAASYGTIGLVTSDRTEVGNLTTPDPAELHRTLQSLVDEDIDHVAIEASSHGLDQFRLDGVSLKIAAFTNLSRDHLDYHSSMADYFAAKSRLFTEVLDRDGTAIVNADDSMTDELIAAAAKRGVEILTYGKQAKDIVLRNVEALPAAQCLSLEVMGRSVEVRLPFIGEFQTMNALCALGIVLADGVEQSQAIAALESLTGVRGRLELAGTLPNGAAVYVDYAHTPDALENVLNALRPHAENNLSVVFGCGGNRDQGKRSEMGATAERLADKIYVTDDNSRFEDAAAVRAQILEGCSKAREVADRKDAIFAAIENLTTGDLLVIAGKGHEQGQIVGDQVLPFDDVEIAKAAIFACSDGGAI